MGLDIGFYTTDGDELLSFRNHHYLLELLLAQPHETIEPYSLGISSMSGEMFGTAII